MDPDDNKILFVSKQLKDIYIDRIRMVYYLSSNTYGILLLTNIWSYWISIVNIIYIEQLKYMLLIAKILITIKHIDWFYY